GRLDGDGARGVALEAVGLSVAPDAEALAARNLAQTRDREVDVGVGRRAGGDVGVVAAAGVERGVADAGVHDWNRLEPTRRGRGGQRLYRVDADVDQDLARVHHSRLDVGVAVVGEQREADGAARVALELADAA